MREPRTEARGGVVEALLVAVIVIEVICVAGGLWAIFRPAGCRGDDVGSPAAARSQATPERSERGHAGGHLCAKCAVLARLGLPYPTCAERGCQRCLPACCRPGSDRCCCLHVDRCTCPPPPDPTGAALPAVPPTHSGRAAELVRLVREVPRALGSPGGTGDRVRCAAPHAARPGPLHPHGALGALPHGGRGRRRGPRRGRRG